MEGSTLTPTLFISTQEKVQVKGARLLGLDKASSEYLNFSFYHLFFIQLSMIVFRHILSLVLLGI